MSKDTSAADEAVDPMISSVREHSADFMDDTVSLRRTLHERPELGNDLPITREAVMEALDGLGLDVMLHESTSGIAATLEGTSPGPTILLRGDMDALEMPEDTGLEFSSRHDGAMHACGHDTHTAMLVGAAKLLAERREDFAGRVLFMFQPGEEGHHGEKAFAMHITSALPSGWIGTRGGPVMASADTLRIRITGKGGHASEPFRAVDPIPVACEIVTALQAMITRSVDVFDPAVVTVGRIVAGTTNNVIPETAEIEGTIRTVSERTRAKVHEGIKRVAENIAAAHGCDGNVEVIFGYPVTTNDDLFAQATLDLANEVRGGDGVVRLPNPAMGAEDFSYVLQELPGAMAFLGGTPQGQNPATAAPNHSNRVYFDEAAMSTGISLYAATALRHLAPS